MVVSKGHNSTAIRSLAELGQTLFGENYSQELSQKRQELDDLQIEWSFIGPLQSNKIKKIVLAASEIQTVSNTKQADLIAKAAIDCGKTPFPVWIEVNIADEPSKHGCTIAELEELTHYIAHQSNLRLKGLMAIPPVEFHDATCTTVPDSYLQLRKLADKVGEGQLSLGMSADLALAIQAGSNLVRVGSAILGPRLKLSE